MEKQYKTKKEKVYHELQEAIRKGINLPGEKLIISKLAKQFNMSEIPVREALQMLAQEGYVLFTPHSGVKVSSLSEEDIRQIFEIRINLESLASRLAVNYLSNSHIETLREMLESSKNYLINKNLKGYWDFNRTFHGFIYKHSNNERLVAMINELCDFSTRYPTYYSCIEEVEESIRAHLEIFDAISERNADLVEELMRRHTTNSYQHIIKLVQQMKSESLDGVTL